MDKNMFKDFNKNSLKFGNFNSLMGNSQLLEKKFDNSSSLNQENFDDEFFGDFEQKFLEAKLDKIISLEELKAIAIAIGKQDWGYVKYILTIICLMLKSYQNINNNCKADQAQSSFLSKPQQLDENDPGMVQRRDKLTPVLNEKAPTGRVISFRNLDRSLEHRPPLQTLMDLGKESENRQNKLLVPESKPLFSNKLNESDPNEFGSEQVQLQLSSLHNIFKKMKDIDIQMNVSNCWSCKDNFCSMHQLNAQSFVNNKELEEEPQSNLFDQKSNFKVFDNQDFLNFSRGFRDNNP
jgi:hypothetical protein